MLKVVGFDSRLLKREGIKRDGTKWNFKSVIGFGIKIDNYEIFDKKYQENLSKIMKKYNIEKEYNYYCVNDFKEIKEIDKIIEEFILLMEPYIKKVHVFYTLFSPKRQKRVKVYGRYAHKNKLKLGMPTRSYTELINKHLINIFPEICAWKLSNYLDPPTQFHLDNFSGHINEAHEELEKKKIQRLVFPSGDCVNPVISMADLFLHFFDKRLAKNNLYLLFDNIRKAIPEYGEKVLAYPLLNRDLPKITPLDKEPIEIFNYYKRPIYWIFKGEIQLDSGTLKRSKPFRKLLDCVSSSGGVVRLFSKMSDASKIKEGDFGVFLNDSGKQAVLSYKKLGKKIVPYALDILIPEEDRSI